MTLKAASLIIPPVRKNAVLSAIFVVSAVFSLGFIGGCKPKDDVRASQVPQTNQPSAPVPQAAEAPPQATHKRVESTRAPDRMSQKPNEVAAGKVTIAGGWVNAGGACDSGASVFFNPDGTFMSEGEKGIWALSGKTLTVTTLTTFDDATSTTQGPDESSGDSGEKSVLTLLSVTDDAARVVLSNGSSANWTRCNS